LSFILPFGLLDFTTGQFIWLLAHVSCILVSAQALWGIVGQAAAGGWTSWLLGLTFVPTGFVLILGQITPLILLGLTALLYFERKGNWFAFGAAIAILSIKSHLVYLFWIVLVLSAMFSKYFFVSILMGHSSYLPSPLRFGFFGIGGATIKVGNGRNTCH
jgi:hypothetical protein